MQRLRRRQGEERVQRLQRGQGQGSRKQKVKGKVNLKGTSNSKGEEVGDQSETSSSNDSEVKTRGGETQWDKDNQQNERNTHAVNTSLKRTHPRATRRSNLSRVKAYSHVDYTW